MSAVTVDKLWKSYADISVLERVDLEVESGAFITMIGTSGCGKSTFLRMLLGQEQPTRGRIWSTASRCPRSPSARSIPASGTICTASSPGSGRKRA